eukprot:g17214.t1
MPAVPELALQLRRSAAAAVPGWGALGRWEDATTSASESFGRVMARLRTRCEALGLLWHTVRGLLGGLESEDMTSSAASPERLRIAQMLLSDAQFVALAAREMSAAILSLAATWKLELDLAPVPPEAAQALGVAAEQLDLGKLAKEAFEE